jgi:hypothetical protein
VRQDNPPEGGPLPSPAQSSRSSWWRRT